MSGLGLSFVNTPVRSRTFRNGQGPLRNVVLLVGALCLLFFEASVCLLEAQTGYFTGLTTTLVSVGLNAPYGVAVDDAGNVFVADSANNAVKEIVAAGGYTTIKVLGGGFLNPHGVAVDKTGNVFVADTANNAVKEIFAAGGYVTVTTLATGLSNPYGVAVDSVGNVFVADTYSSTVKEFTVASGYATFTTLGSGFLYTTSVAVDATGNVFVADYGNNAVKEILATGGYTTVVTLGSGFDHPEGVAVDSSGNVFVGAHNVSEIVASGGYTSVRSLGALGSYGSAGVAVDGNGNIFIANNASNAVQEIMTEGVNLGAVNVGTGTPSTAAISFTALTSGSVRAPIVSTQGNTGQDFADAGAGDTCVAGAVQPGDTCTVNVTFTPSVSGSRYGAVTLSNSAGAVIASAYLYGTGLGPQLTFSPAKQSAIGSAPLDPAGVAVDGSGNIFVADAGNNAVKEFLAAGGYATVNTLGSGFSSPSSVAIDGAGNIFIADAGSNSVKEILAAGGYTTVNLIGGGFGAPRGVAVDGFGNVFVADTGNNAIREVLASGGYGTTISLGSGFAGPTGVAVDTSGNVFVADSGNNAVKEIAAAGGYATVAAVGSGFAAPNGVAVDGIGNVFVADGGNSAVKEILATSGYATVNTLTGEFSDPLGVAVDGSGNIYVANSGANAIAKLDFVDPPALTFASTPDGSTSSDSPQTVTLTNIGNVALTFPAPGTGLNPTISTGFTVDGASTCPQISSSSSAASLAAGSSCTDLISFAPVTQGTITGSLVTQDNDLNASAPAYATQTIKLNGTATATSPTIVFIVPNHVYGDAPFTVTATSNSNGAFTYSVVSGPAAIAGNVVTITGVGTVVLVASEAAGTNYIAGSAEATFTVAPAVPTIVFTVPNHTAGDAPFIVSATSNSTGAFTYSVVSGPATIAGSTVTLTGAGTVVLQASEAADANYDAATKDATFTVAALSPTIVFTVPNHVYGDPPFAVSATSNSTGAFTYSVVSGPATITGTTVTITGAGTVVLMASEAADANYMAASMRATFTVAPAVPTIVFSVPNHIASDAPFTVNATSNSTGAFTYSVVSGPATIAGSTVTLTGPGTVVLQASETADANYSAGTKDATFIVTGLPPGIVFTVPNHLYGDAPFVVSASSNSNGAFSYLVLSGPATIAGATVTITGAGQVVLQALQAASGNYSAASAETTFTVAGTILLSATPDSATAAQGSPATFNVTAAPGGATNFANAIDLNAYGLPVGFISTFAPTSLPAGSASTQVALTIQTSASAAIVRKPRMGIPSASIVFAFLVLPLFGFKAGRSALRKACSRPTSMLIVFLSLGALLALTGCGSGFYQQPQKYSVIVIATDSVTGATATTEVSLIVQ